MTTPRYLTVADLKAYVSTEKVVDDAFYVDAINTAELMIDNALRRRMEVASATSARVYVPTGAEYQFIHDCTAITSVVHNGTTLTSGTDYQAEPLNGVTLAGEATPYFRLLRVYLSWAPQIAGKATITVTATWGWPAIPSMVRESCKILAKDIFNERKSGGYGLVDITQAGGVGTRENWIVRKTIAAYKRFDAIGAA